MRLRSLFLVLGTLVVFQVNAEDLVSKVVDSVEPASLVNLDEDPAKLTSVGDAPQMEEGAPVVGEDGKMPAVPKNRWKQNRNDPNCNTTPQQQQQGNCNNKCGCSDVQGPPGTCGNSIKGPSGPVGPPGDQGAPGDQGPQGPMGQNGQPGPDGTRGAKGARGPLGPPGAPGDIGVPGTCGRPGFSGPMGPQGAQGPPGTNGNDGQPGCDGQDGKPGQRGRDGTPGNPGPNGDKGPKGPQGPPGPDGRPGPQGPPGSDGGDVQGRPGPRGPKGPNGQQGPSGPDGRPGPMGAPGYPGRPGPMGDQGPQGDQGEQSCYQTQTCVANFIYARHSQSTDVPPCARATHKNLWTGWSLLHTEDEARHFVQDLGRASSCMQQFEPMPFMFCGSNEVCTWGARTATSYWLASNERQQYISLFGLDDSRERPLSDIGDIKRQISRCSVCVSCGPIIAIHSQNTSVPECPSPAWTSLWTGYSMAMHAVGPMGGGQPLESPGSCLEDFRHHPYIECTSTGQCAYYSEKMTYWLAGLDQMPTNTIDPAQLSVVKKREQAISNIGRCRVCSLEMTAHRR